MWADDSKLRSIPRKETAKGEKSNFLKERTGRGGREASGTS